MMEDGMRAEEKEEDGMSEKELENQDEEDRTAGSIPGEKHCSFGISCSSLRSLIRPLFYPVTAFLVFLSHITFTLRAPSTSFIYHSHPNSLI